jgi:hypothetical protein
MTIGGWFYVPSYAGAGEFHSPFSLNYTASNASETVQWEADDTANAGIMVIDYPPDYESIETPTYAAGTWWYVAIRWTPLGGGQWTVDTFLFDTAGSLVLRDTRTRTTHSGESPAAFYVARTNGWTRDLRGSAQYVGLWDSALSDGQIEAQSASALMLVSAWAWLPLHDGDTSDYSGNSRVVTVGGTPTASSVGVWNLTSQAGTAPGQLADSTASNLPLNLTSQEGTAPGQLADSTASNLPLNLTSQEGTAPGQLADSTASNLPTVSNTSMAGTAPGQFADTDTAFPLPATTDVDVLVFAGQSNVQAWGGTGTVEGYPRYDARMFLDSRDGPAHSGAGLEALSYFIKDGTSDPYHGPWLEGASQYLDAVTPTRPLLVAMIGDGGTNIQTWATGALSAPLAAFIADALAAFGGTPMRVQFVWIQGETDAQAGTGSTYQSYLEQVRSNVRAALGAWTRFQVVGLHPEWPDLPDLAVVRAAQQAVGTSEPLSRYIEPGSITPWTSYQTGSSGDDRYHYNPAGIALLADLITSSLLDADPTSTELAATSPPPTAESAATTIKTEIIVMPTTRLRIPPSGPFTGGGSVINYLSLILTSGVALPAGSSVVVLTGSLDVQLGDWIVPVGGAATCTYGETTSQIIGTTYSAENEGELGAASPVQLGQTVFALPSADPVAFPVGGKAVQMLVGGFVNLRLALAATGEAGAAVAHGTFITFLQFRP